MDMGTEDLKLLGFHLVEKDPMTSRASQLDVPPDQRSS